MNAQTIGIFLLVLAVLFLLGDKVPVVGHLPGDMHLHGRHGHVFVPLGTCVAVSIVLSLLLGMFGRK